MDSEPQQDIFFLLNSLVLQRTASSTKCNLSSLSLLGECLIRLMDDRAWDVAWSWNAPPFYSTAIGGWARGAAALTSEGWVNILSGLPFTFTVSLYLEKSSSLSKSASHPRNLKQWGNRPMGCPSLFTQWDVPHHLSNGMTLTIYPMGCPSLFIQWNVSHYLSNGISLIIYPSHSCCCY